MSKFLIKPSADKIQISAMGSNLISIFFNKSILLQSKTDE